MTEVERHVRFGLKVDILAKRKHHLWCASDSVDRLGHPTLGGGKIKSQLGGPRLRPVAKSVVNELPVIAGYIAQARRSAAFCLIESCTSLKQIRNKGSEKLLNSSAVQGEADAL
jgi:hypothetical protein